MRSLVGHRKQRHGDTIVGGSFAGVVVTDPAGQPYAVPFTGDQGDALRGDGTFGPGTAIVAGGLELLWDEELGNYVVPR